jgi:tRNA 2-thiouridine synthesizing protein E
MIENHHTMVSKVRIDTDGYLLDASEWSTELATELAEASGIEKLSATHWKIIRALREHYVDGDPEIRHFCAGLDLEDGCVTRLFGDPVIAWQIAGLPKSGIDMSAYMPTSHLV